jgi:hypothetical protein
MCTATAEPLCFSQLAGPVGAGDLLGAGVVAAVAGAPAERAAAAEEFAAVL